MSSSLSQFCFALLADPEVSVFRGPGSDPRRLRAARADHHQLGNLDGGFPLQDSSLDVFLRVLLGVLLGEVHTLYDGSPLIGMDAQNLALLSTVPSGEHHHLIILADVRLGLGALRLT